MAPVKNGRLLFNEVPTGYPEPGKTTVYDETQTIDLDNAPLSGGFLSKVLVFSSDPYLRGKMRDPSVKSYSPAFVLGEPIYNYGVSVVLRSETPSVKPGDHVYGILPFQQYVVRPDLEGLRVLKNEEKLPWSAYVGVAGMPGQTAYYGWKEYADPQKNDTVFVTAGAGPVGSFVIQLAKAAGLKVIASAGSKEKVAFLKSIGTDVAFNYKTESTREVLQKEGPVNIYWDNVGGESLEAALEFSGKDARFIECGMISGYNNAPVPIKNLMHIVAKQLKIYGFLVFSLAAKYDEEFYREVPKRIASGEIKYTEDLTHGLDKGGDALLAIQKGTNKGKSVIVVSDK